MPGAKFILTSKTVWVNGLTLAALIVQGLTGSAPLPYEDQALILATVNLILRLLTNRPVKL